MEGEVSENGSVNIVLSFVNEGKKGRNILKGKLSGRQGSGKFRHMGGQCAGVIEMAKM